jgi:hypothetical protein
MTATRGGAVTPLFAVLVCADSVWPLQSPEQAGLHFLHFEGGRATGTDTQRVAFAHPKLLVVDFLKPMDFRFEALAGWATHARSYRQMSFCLGAQ